MEPGMELTEKQSATLVTPKKGKGKDSTDRPKVAEKPKHTISLTEAVKIKEYNPDTKKLQATRAYGKVNFQTRPEETSSEYARLDKETDTDNILELLQKDWKLTRPNLLLSVTGAAEEFNCENRTRVFDSIVGAADSTDAWIITGGTNVGVMKYTGEAVKKHQDTTGKDVTTIGIATWGVVKESHRTKLTRTEKEIEDAKHKKKKDNSFIWANLRGQKEKNSLGSYLPPKELPDPNQTQSEEEGADLNPNHTHFILVDSHVNNKFGGEIDLRSKLEGAISSNWREVNPKSSKGTEGTAPLNGNVNDAVSPENPSTEGELLLIYRLA
ncbi:transient receptor potential cation channel subfamily M member-like 2 [Amphiura filiformis]|uniref:transient receptor potential cation channel subfamily M member-like 2 n=1 Tax=Amphiura filiformis TaxID=82378 RepID=UPI003B222D55